MSDDLLKNKVRLGLYLISQDVNRGYDTFDSAVVAAQNEEAARLIHPIAIWNLGSAPGANPFKDHINCWCKPEEVEVERIGVAAEGLEPGKVICASFNAG